MKTLIAKTLVFLTLTLATCVVSMFLLRHFTDQQKNFQLPDETKYLFAGHSHVRLAINDSLIKGTRNVSEEGEAYIYTLQKLKTYLHFNPQVKYVFLECSNNSVSEFFDSRTWNQHFIKTKLPDYNIPIDSEDLGLLLSHEPLTTIETFSISAKAQLEFLLSRQSDYPSSAEWFKHRYYSQSDVDSILHHSKIDTLSQLQKNPSEHALFYIGKIVRFCKEHTVQPVLMRSPVHPAWEYLLNEDMFCSEIRRRFPEVVFLDFGHYPMPDDEFRDLAHLNYKGAIRFCQLFDSLIATGAVDSYKPGEYPKFGSGGCQ